MDLLHRMGAVSEGGENCQWIDGFVALAAISLAGEKAGGRFFQDKVREIMHLHSLGMEDVNFCLCPEKCPVRFHWYPFASSIHGLPPEFRGGKTYPAYTVRLVAVAFVSTTPKQSSTRKIQ